MIQNSKLSRRDAIKAATGGVVLSGLAASTAGAAPLATEAEILRERIGTQFTVADDGAVYTLEEVAVLSPRVRPPMTLGHREPLALVFRLDSGDKVSDGTHMFRAALRSPEVLMVSSYEGEDGVPRLEAVLN